VDEAPTLDLGKHPPEGMPPLSPHKGPNVKSTGHTHHRVAAAAPSPFITDVHPSVRPIVREWEGRRAKRRFWLLDAALEASASSRSRAFLVSVALAMVLSVAPAYFFALWTIGPA
jgi:hypothetical protein